MPNFLEVPEFSDETLFKETGGKWVCKSVLEMFPLLRPFHCVSRNCIMVSTFAGSD